MTRRSRNYADGKAFTFTFMMALLIPCTFAEEHKLSKDGVGPIVLSTTVQVDGKNAVLRVSGRNEAGESIAYVKFCIQPAGQTKGCDFELWTRAPWKHGEDLTWPPLKGTF